MQTIGALSEIAASEQAREELAKVWFVRMAETASFGEIGDLPVSWISREGPSLIGEILRGLERAPGEPAAPERSTAATARLGRLRRGESAAERTTRDLAALQSLLIEALAVGRPGEVAGFARTAQNLAERFGEILAGAAGAIVGEPGASRRDELTGLDGPADLHEWIGGLVAEYRRYDHPFSICMVDIQGRDRLSEAFSDQLADRMLASVAAAVGPRVRSVDRAFRTAEDEICVVAPHSTAIQLRPLGERLAGAVAASQPGDGPPLAVAIGLASCPAHGESEEELTAAAHEGVYMAQADGVAVGISGLDEGIFT